MEIFEVLRSIGPLSVTELGELFRQESTGLYYHIRLLQKAGLVHSVERPGSEAFAASVPCVKLKVNLKIAKESKRLGKLVDGFGAASRKSVSSATSPAHRGIALRGLRWENLDASEVARIEKLQRQILEICDQSRSRRGRSKRIDQANANWHVGCFMTSVGDEQLPIAGIECVNGVG